jgi:hypothetical protein
MGAGVVYNPAITIFYCVRLDTSMFTVAARVDADAGDRRWMVKNDDPLQNSINLLVDGVLT